MTQHAIPEGVALTKIGLGFDVHAFAPDRKLILGGVDIPHYHGR
ncbi:MAG: 2-C-methyl-D-erythritol 2,4-cyclodiphosphate synthase, partial [Anaerotardibacter sp.]